MRLRSFLAINVSALYNLHMPKTGGTEPMKNIHRVYERLESKVKLQYYSDNVSV